MKRYSISNNDKLIEFEITHRPAVRRRIHLEINGEGDLRVVAPRRMSRRDIQTTLQQRAPHVERFLSRARERQKDLPEYFYGNGEEHLFMGQRYPLDIMEWQGKGGKVSLAAGRIEVTVPESANDRVRSLLETWYRRRAQQHFAKRLIEYSEAAPWTGGEVPPMRLRRMKRTWGSCSSAGVITLNPHLVKSPPECIDYVIAHEVCHLRQHNHGKAFYALQQQLYPGWREARAHLHDKGHIYLHA